MVERGGVREVQALLKVSRSRAKALVNSEGFPDPVGVHVYGLMWDMDQVQEWAKEQGRLVHRKSQATQGTPAKSHRRIA